MRNPENREKYGNIFGNGLDMPTPAGVDQDNWKYVAEENNYVYIGKPDKIRRMDVVSKQTVNHKRQAINKVA